jgi:hypothetical protein
VLIGVLIEVKEIVDFLFRNNQCVPLRQRADVKEGKTMFALCHFIAGNLSIDDACEYGGQTNG